MEKKSISDSNDIVIAVVWTLLFFNYIIIDIVLGVNGLNGVSCNTFGRSVPDWFLSTNTLTL